MFLFGLRSFFKRLLIVAVILGLMLLWSVYSASAMLNFPNDSISQHFEFNANTPSAVNGGTVLLTSSVRTILQVSWDSKVGSGSKGWLYCGATSEGNEIVENHGVDFYVLPISFVCSSEIRVVITGNSGDGEHF